jgi:hypothetical protein
MAIFPLETPHDLCYQTNKQTNKKSAETVTFYACVYRCCAAVADLYTPIDKCATFCAIKEKIFRAINHQRRTKDEEEEKEARWVSRLLPNGIQPFKDAAPLAVGYCF